MSVETVGFDYKDRKFPEWLRFWHPEAADVVADYDPKTPTLVINSNGKAGARHVIVFSDIPKDAAGFDRQVDDDMYPGAALVLPGHPYILSESQRPLDHDVTVTPKNLMEKLEATKKPVKVLVDTLLWPYLPDRQLYERVVVMAVFGWETYMMKARFEHCELVRFDRNELPSLAPTCWWPDVEETSPEEAQGSKARELQPA